MSRNILRQGIRYNHRKPCTLLHDNFVKALTISEVSNMSTRPSSNSPLMLALIPLVVACLAGGVEAAGRNARESILFRADPLWLSGWPAVPRDRPPSRLCPD